MSVRGKVGRPTTYLPFMPFNKAYFVALYCIDFPIRDLAVGRLLAGRAKGTVCTVGSRPGEEWWGNGL